MAISVKTENVASYVSTLDLLRCTLARLRNPQNCALGKMRSQNLQSDRQFVFGLAARHGDSGDAGQIRRYGVDVRKVHGERIIHFFAQLERRRGTDGRRNRVDLPERLLEVTSQQRAHTLRLQVVGVV